ncbi:MAG: DUF2478 domain-containing protein [Hyphomicrobiaceae bacterium]
MQTPTISVDDLVPVAGIRFEPGDTIDDLLEDIANDMKRRGVRLAGLVQSEEARDDGQCCPATYVTDLRDGARIRISADRGTGARGCRLDASALSEAAKRVEQAILDGAQVLIVNRFGQSESDGRGLRSTIELALECGVPVIVGVREAYSAAWQDFHGGLAIELPFEKDPIVAWLDSTTSKTSDDRTAATEPA